MIRTDKNTILRVAGMNYSQKLSTVRCNPAHIYGDDPATDRDSSEKRARKFGHKLFYAVPLANALVCHKVTETIVHVASGAEIVHTDEEGNEHTVRIYKPAFNDQARIEYAAGRYAVQP